MNLQEENRDGYLVSAHMKKVWAVQLELLKKLLEVCDKYQLKIWADGGTLLGTIRHKGYIPWDDDIDMAMFRDDYDKLVQIAPKEFDHPYFFQCGYTEKCYIRGHSQLRMDSTAAMLLAPAFVNTHQGIFIDIFPYDAVPDDEQEMKKLIEEKNRLMDRMVHAVVFDWLHPVRSIRLSLKKSSFSEMYEDFENAFRKYRIEDNNCVSCLSFMVDLEHFLRDKQWYDETLAMPFEDCMMPVPVGYHEILTKQYGNYMIPVKAPSYHGGFWKLDAEKSYLDYLPELRTLCKRIHRRVYVQRIKNIFRNGK